MVVFSTPSGYYQNSWSRNRGPNPPTGRAKIPPIRALNFAPLSRARPRAPHSDAGSLGQLWAARGGCARRSGERRRRLTANARARPFRRLARSGARSASRARPYDLPDSRGARRQPLCALRELRLSGALLKAHPVGRAARVSFLHASLTLAAVVFLLHRGVHTAAVGDAGASTWRPRSRLRRRAEGGGQAGPQARAHPALRDRAAPALAGVSSHAWRWRTESGGVHRRL